MLLRVRALLLSLLLVLAGCSSAAPTAALRRDAGLSPAPEPSLVAPATASSPTEAARESSASPLQKPKRGARGPAPANGCLVQSDQPLHTGERGLALLLGDVDAVAVFEASPVALSLWLAQPDGTFASGPRLALETKVAHAAAACAQGSCELAWTDERARLLTLALSAGRISPPRELATGVDRRFAPAVARAGDRLHFAYTKTVDEAMHTWWISRQGSQLTSARDLTPKGHGAAAATFVLGAAQPTLVFIDAHAGISPLLELGFDARGQPGEVVVRTPVSQPYAPPLLSAVRWQDGQVEVMFSLVGRMAMTAVARVPLHKAADPTALSPSRGYGELAFAAARSRRRALFALEVPTASKPDAPRILALKLLDGIRTDEGPSFPADARRPSVASSGRAGAYTLSYVHDGLVHGVQVTCDDQ